MELVNATRMVAGFTIGVEPSGRESLVVVAKGTFRLPEADEPLLLADEQVPLVMSDVFHGEPGRSAPRYEAELTPRKRRCDVLLDGSAYAPQGQSVTRLPVALRIGNWLKTFTVVGDRVWQAGAASIRPAPPEPFVRMPVNYDRAFGGTDDRSDDPAEHAAYTRNPSGRGFHRALKPAWVDGSPLPNTEENENPVLHCDGNYQPMALGPIGRHWEPRYRYAGTFDDRWLEEHFPFLPPDFDEQYYQSAPLDQQIPFPQGGETVVLANLTPSGRTRFVLPRFDAPIHFIGVDGERETGSLTLDTISLEPDLRRVTLLWRAARPLRRNVFEIPQVVVGKRSTEWWAERETIAFPIPLALVSNEWDELFPEDE
jgi:hypothetical protein